MEAPASSANLGSGFDVFAIALKQPKDRLTLESAPGGVSITVRRIGGLPGSPEENVVGAVAKAVMADNGVKGGISMLLRKGVPVRAGLGSSAASSVAAAVGTSVLIRSESSGTLGSASGSPRARLTTTTSQRRKLVAPGGRAA
ncbi:MAG: hypothetical protein LYZ69_08395 [Nitrososphaerales archaeon]|nr:hypothetical protein [Nitrososphaerales archaeon]